METNIEVIIIDEVFCSLFYVANAFLARSHRKMLLFLFLFKAYDPPNVYFAYSTRAQ